MADTETMFGVVRVLTCGIWLAAALFKIFHFQGFADMLAKFNQPLPRAMAAGVVAIELVGVILVLANMVVWAVALVWIAFIIYGTWVEHRRVILPDGSIDRAEYIHVFKNVSLIGGLVALMVLDPNKPLWLVNWLGG